MSKCYCIFLFFEFVLLTIYAQPQSPPQPNQQVPPVNQQQQYVPPPQGQQIPNQQQQQYNQPQQGQQIPNQQQQYVPPPQGQQIPNMAQQQQYNQPPQGQQIPNMAQQQYNQPPQGQQIPNMAQQQQQQYNQPPQGQQIPNQQIPNQQIPNQQIPNQQIPNQQIPNQGQQQQYTQPPPTQNQQQAQNTPPPQQPNQPTQQATPTPEPPKNEPDSDNTKQDKAKKAKQADSTPFMEDDPKFKKFAAEWKKKMGDYQSQYVYMIPIPYRSKVEYYENITHVPVKLRGAFILDDPKTDKMEFTLEDPNGKTIYHQVGTAGIFNIDANINGFYKIILHNKFGGSEIKPSYTMNTGQNLILETKSLNKTEAKMNELAEFLKKYQTENQLRRMSKRKRMKRLSKTNKFFFAFSLIETIVLIIVSCWQYYYLKHLFEIKGSL